jgi:hypothetical protein
MEKENIIWAQLKGDRYLTDFINPCNETYPDKSFAKERSKFLRSVTMNRIVMEHLEKKFYRSSKSCKTRTESAAA